MTNASTNMAYHGFIDVQINYKGKTINFTKHNEGTTYLKQVFARVLTGNYNIGQDTPQLLDLEYQTGDGKWVSYLLGKIDLTSKKPYRYGNQWFASFTATLTSSNLSDYIQEGSGVNYRFAITTNKLSIYDDSTEAFAYVSVSDELLSKIVPGSQAIVTWNMQLINEEELNQETE